MAAGQELAFATAAVISAQQAVVPTPNARKALIEGHALVDSVAKVITEFTGKSDIPQSWLKDCEAKFKIAGLPAELHAKAAGSKLRKSVTILQPG